MPKVTFIIVEKSYLIRKGLSSIIEKIPNTQVVHQFDQADELNTSFLQDADFIICNPNLISSIHANVLLHGRLICLTDHKNSDSDQKVNWVEHIYIDDTQKQILKKLNHIIGNRAKKGSNTGIPDEISKREADILKNIALGYSNKEIADKLFISTHTVVTHRKNITRKLGIKTVPGLTIYAILNKLIDINDSGQPT